MKNSPVGASDGWQPTRLFFCSNCNALYQLIKVEAGPENGSRVNAKENSFSNILCCERPRVTESKRARPRAPVTQEWLESAS